jgi:hypothetical protein
MKNTLSTEPKHKNEVQNEEIKHIKISGDNLKI